MEKGKILVVDDDAFFRTLCSDILSSEGFFVRSVSCGTDAVSLVEGEEPFDIILTDLMMPDLNGIEVLKRVKQHNRLIDVIVLTGHGSIETAIEALKSGAYDYIRKPLNKDELLLSVKACMENRKLLEENQEMKQSLKLFEVTRAIATCLDTGSLQELTIDAFMQMVPADAGITAFYEGDKNLEIKSVRHVSLNDAEPVVKALKRYFERRMRGQAEIRELKGEDLRESWEGFSQEYSSVLMIPITKGSEAAGFSFILRKSTRGLSPRELQCCSFIAEHASLAFLNSVRYAEAKGMVFIDSLTGLYNSKYLEMALEKELKRAERMLMPFTVLFIDIDNFKLINDRNDHLVGSKILIEVSRVFLTCVREIDTVIRYGGDEYVMILVGADYNVAFNVADRIRKTVEQHEFLKEEGLSIKLTISIGVATYPVHSKDKRELLRLADKAMYRAKDMARNFVYLAPLPGTQGS